MNEVHTRDLQNAVMKHHQNNPHVSMEASFKYVMSNSSAFRALPTACIDKARKYLALPGTPTKDVYVPQHGIETVNHLVSKTNDCSYYGQYEGSSLGYIFNCVLGSLVQSKKVNKLDVISAKNRLGLLIDDKLISHGPYDAESYAADTRALVGATRRHQKQHPKATLAASYMLELMRSEHFKQLPILWLAEARSQLGLPVHAVSIQPVAQKPNSTITKVHAERVVVDNKKMIKILKFENVCLLSDLPHEYTSHSPSYCWFRQGVELHYSTRQISILRIVLPSDILSLKAFGKMIKTMKEAGVRLSKINKTAKLENEHSGKFMVSI